MSDSTPAAASEPSDEAARKRRRRGSRGGRNRNRSRSTQSTQAQSTAEVDVDVDRMPDDMPDRPIEGVPSPEAAERATVKPFLTPKVPPPVAAAPESEPAAEGEAEPAKSGGRKRRRRGGRGRGKKPDATTAAVDEALELDEETLALRRGRERKGRPVGRYQMCVHVREGATQIAVLEGRALLEHYVSRPQDDVSQIDGNIYLGKVQ